MRPFGNVWSVRTPFGDIEIEVHPASVDAPGREASLREVRHLLHDFECRRPQARGTVLAVYRWLWGLDRLRRSDARALDSSSPRADAVADELLFAARAGLIVARRRERRSLSVPLDERPEEVLGPESSEDAAPRSKSWVGVALVDEGGTPVPNRPYRIVKPDGTTVDGTLDSRGVAMIKDLDPGNCQIWCPYVEPRPATTHDVQRGEHVSGIAQRFGFDDYHDVWNHPDNADLQSRRIDPHVLQPGDTLAIPESKARPAANRPTGAKHQFQIERSPLKLRLKLLDLSAKPVANAQVTVAESALTTDGDGLVEATVDKSAKDALLATPSNPEVHLSVGDLNPHDDTSDAGYKARLYNLGFLWDPTVEDIDDELLIALEDFQAQYQLPVSGQLDDATKAQLLEAHGC